MKQKLIITFDEETTAKYLELAGRQTEAEVNADCCPSGVTIQIQIGVLADTAFFVRSDENIEIGEVNVDLVDV